MSTENVHMSTRRRGVAVFLVLIVIPVMLGFAALTVDVGIMYNSRTDLQNAADAAALAATNVLGDDRSSAGVARARQAAIDIVNQHYNLGRNLKIGPDDVVFGRIDFNAEATRYDFVPTNLFPDSVRINVRASKGSSNGPIPLAFAAIFGKHTADIDASALAGLTGARDVAIVIDLSGSMKFDSELRFYRVTDTINMRDVWCALDGPKPSPNYRPGPEDQTEYRYDTGPAFGIMDTWGDPITKSYDPSTDPGLWYIPNNAACSISAITSSLTARGYTSSQRNTIMNSTSSTTWPNRVAVMTGLAEWKPSSSSDTSVSSSELKWAAYPSWRKSWTWQEYIDWSTGTNNRLVTENSKFKFRFGVKTFVQFILDRRYAFSESDLSGTPVQPMQSIKDGVQVLVEGMRSFDHASLIVFATTARKEINLNSDLQKVSDRLFAMQPNYYDSNTNIGDGLRLAIQEVTSSRARKNARPMIILMSDGVSNAGPDEISVAQEAVDAGIPVYTISVGAGADRSVLQKIAEMTGAQEFFADGSAEEYTAELRQIFRTLGTLGFVTLVE